ncbi:hypothetical protein [Streptomyces sp. NPDC021212]|uniref:hypothetical protein n=1 Tax=Streptomyces sp. NPDC021212 TaxID=3365118 RepID=UPI0037976D4F
MISIGLAELLASDVLGTSSKVVRRPVEASQDAEPARRRRLHQSQGMSTQLFDLLGLKPLDEVVQIAVVMGGSQDSPCRPCLLPRQRPTEKTADDSASGARRRERSRQQRSPGPLAWGFVLERVTRIELAL